MISPESVVTVGDSPNDETLFTFSFRWAANLNHYVDQSRLPNY
jgi:hydroxymethylpyrimidine pyrophosphatase-like HAD family hydrolase